MALKMHLGSLFGGYTMLNNKKIRNMTKLAIYEQKEGKEDIRMSKFYKSDYVQYNLLKTCISVTVAYLLVLVMIVVYYSEFIISEAVTLDYKAIGVKVLAIYILIMVTYIIGTIFRYSLKYERSRSRLARYYRRLKSLEKLNRD